MARDRVRELKDASRVVIDRAALIASSATPMKRREFLATVPAAALAAAARRAQASSPSALQLWYRKPAASWFEALPVGNGRLGAMVFGGVETERLQLNEDTLWSGCPRDWNNPGAKEHLPIVRKLVMEDENYVAADKECRKMQGPYNESFVPLGDLTLKLSHGGAVDGYRRDLDLATGVASVSYRVAGVEYRREVFSSAVDQVLVIRMTAGKPKALSAALSASARPLHGAATSAERNHPARRQSSVARQAELLEG